jgi:excisionase family DNA binding protein
MTGTPAPHIRTARRSSRATGEQEPGPAGTRPGQAEEGPLSEVTPQPAERLAYSVDEVAQITGLSRDLLYDQMRSGRLGSIKVGRRRIITRQHLDAFLARAAS